MCEALASHYMLLSITIIMTQLDALRKLPRLYILLCSFFEWGETVKSRTCTGILGTGLVILAVLAPLCSGCGSAPEPEEHAFGGIELIVAL